MLITVGISETEPDVAETVIVGKLIKEVLVWVLLNWLFKVKEPVVDPDTRVNTSTSTESSSNMSDLFTLVVRLSD